MIQNILNEQVIMQTYRTREKIYIAYDEKKKYLQDQKGECKGYTEEEKKDLKILEFLFQNGFSNENLGTYLYKDVISRIIEYLNKPSKTSEIEELKQQLNNAYSQFYFDISRNEKDMGLKTFHYCIQSALANLDDKNSNFIEEISSQKKLNYGQLAFEIASYMLEHELRLEDEQAILQKSSNCLVLSKNIKLRSNA